MESLCNKVASPLPEFLLKKDSVQKFFCDFCEIFKFLTFDFNANTEHIFVCCDNFGSHHPE